MKNLWYGETAIDVIDDNNVIDAEIIMKPKNVTLVVDGHEIPIRCERVDISYEKHGGRIVSMQMKTFDALWVEKAEEIDKA